MRDLYGLGRCFEGIRGVGRLLIRLIICGACIIIGYYVVFLKEYRVSAFLVLSIFRFFECIDFLFLLGLFVRWDGDAFSFREVICRGVGLVCLRLG